MIDPNPQHEIERLKKKIKKLECVADLRRKQARTYRQRDRENAEQMKRSMGGFEKVLASLYGK